MPAADRNRRRADEDEVTDPLIRETLLDGRYVLVRRLARGGMSVVYLAHHVGLGRKVALKILRPPPEVRAAYDFAAWFRAEARVLASFNHPNVVVIHDVGPLGPNGFFLAMEHVDGPSLEEVLARGPLPPRRALAYVAQVVRALRYAHQRGVLHGDVKPSNVLLTEDAEGNDLVKVIDFGLAGALAAGPGAPLLGSPQVVAPEQIRGGPVGPAADVYGVGALLARCLTGRFPFRGTDPDGLLAQHLGTPAPRLDALAPGRTFPEGLEGLVARCLAKDPAARFPSMDALLSALDAVELDAPPTEAPAAPTVAAWRLPVGAALGVALAAAVGLVAAVSLRAEPDDAVLAPVTAEVALPSRITAVPTAPATPPPASEPPPAPRTPRVRRAPAPEPVPEPEIAPEVRVTRARPRSEAPAPDPLGR